MRHANHLTAAPAASFRSRWSERLRQIVLWLMLTSIGAASLVQANTATVGSGTASTSSASASSALPGMGGSSAPSSSGVNWRICERPPVCFGSDEARRQWARDNQCQFLEDVCQGPRDNQPPPEEDRGFWGSLWDGVRSGLTYGYQFVKGLVEGLKTQVTDLWALVTDPAEAVRGLIELGKAFYRDPQGTARAIGQLLGQEIADTITRATQCGAFDLGKVIGENVNPVVVLRLGTRLARFGGRLDDAVQATKRDFGCASFAADTPVLTPDGAMPIGQIRIGQLVLSRSENGFADQPRPVTRVFQREAPSYRVLTTESDRLRVTDEHPLWIQGKGWVAAEKVTEDDVISGLHGDQLVVRNEPVPEPLTVHNFSVDQTPNYFVGNEGAWAHNTKCDLSSRRVTVDIRTVNGRAPELNDPKPNTTYRVNGGQQVFEVDELGRTTRAQATITADTLDTTLRNCYQQRRAVSICEGIQGDDGGHLVGHKLGGVGERVNILPQASGLNRGAWNQMEREWARLAADGRRVDVSVMPVYAPGDARRPVRFEVDWSIDGVTQPGRVFTNG